MCPRFTLTSSPGAVARAFGLDAIEPFPPRYNIAPTQPILIVHEAMPAPRGPKRRAQLARWGLIPGWVRDPSQLPLLYSAQAETAAARNSFRGALRYRRCLVPASGFYDWQRRPDGGRQPWFLRGAGPEPLAFAGLLETYLASDGSEIDTAAILTVPAAEDLAAILVRTPAVVAAADTDRWLACADYEPDAVADILEPVPVGTFDAVAVSDRINSVANMGPAVQEEVLPRDP
ncbi:SOS response-associated peptidase [Aureimonas jatrophae]|uniref:Abasic site processing protein n=1 Tax=Aureimonas jatrophae TaxID=1166073 RepID=A0A1H0CXE9_9HYPH|nr:SOS response-associated peptidase [Aureimonas jatrophae]MBB3949399.1 putative SOS response-associated peptidase YedK [Aureimonas jatrophae]SDN62565.1 Putative SOS response-associated peptidase YedK [Aureimonas jatrophae]